MDRVRIATRRSALALWQANHVRDLLLEAHAGLEVELVPIVTRGDRILDRPLAEIGGKGLFLKELEVSMLEGESDLAVHSMKDMPAEETPGLVLQAALPRANPFDAWISADGAGLHELPAGARVGTSSLRRRCQVLAARPDVEVVELRGNVDTRLAKLDAGDYDAIILACAGLERLGLGDRITARLAPPDWLPAGTQGIIGLQCRAEDTALFERIAPLADAAAMRQARAERTVLADLQGSCQVPLAVYAELDGDSITLTGLVGTPDGRRILRASERGTDPEATGRALAEALRAQGAEEIIGALSGH
jgi:hydroxymethylbilane synthase